MQDLTYIRIYVCTVRVYVCVYIDLLGVFAKLRKAIISFVMSVRPSPHPSALNNSATTGRILMKFDISAFFESLLRKLKFH